MKVTIRNLGKIDRATVDIRPLTLLVGENNTNKTWTAYSIYALLRALSPDFEDGRFVPRISTPSVAKHIKLLVAQAVDRIIAARGTASINLEFSRQAILETVTTDVRLTLGSRQLARVLAAPPELLKRASVSLQIPREQLERGSKFFIVALSKDGTQLLYGETNHAPSAKPTFEGFDSKTFSKFFSKFRFHRLTITFGEKESLDWRRRLESLLLRFAVSSLKSVVALPAERKAIVALYKKLDNEVSSQLPLPLSDFINSLKQEEAGASDSRSGAKVRRPNAELYSKIEGVLGGHVTFESSALGERLVFSPAKKVMLPIQAASSMVRSITGLLFAIQRFYGDGNALIIDEPEMNAHPVAQLAMAEILAALANSGNYILATTHSPYILDHVNNLIAAGELSSKTTAKATEAFVLKMKESFLSSKNVSAYEMSPSGVVSSLMDPKRKRITAATFGDVSSTLENLYGTLLEMADQ